MITSWRELWSMMKNFATWFEIKYGRCLGLNRKKGGAELHREGKHVLALN
jgi:hypothetical protein